MPTNLIKRPHPQLPAGAFEIEINCAFDNTVGGCSLSRIPASIAFDALGLVLLLSSSLTAYTPGSDTSFMVPDYL